MIHPTLIWFVASLVFLMLEMGHPGLFFFLSFFFGALAAAGMSFMEFPVLVQYGIFFLISALSFYMLKLWVKKKIKYGRITNAQALVGKKGIVIKEISLNDVGLVKIGGEIWSAKTIHRQSIAVDEWVEVIEVRGAHVIVTKK